MTTLVLGIGNTLLTDEGAGVHVVEHLRRTYPDLSGVRYLDGGTLSFTLAADIEAVDNLIVIDAAQLNGAPGTVKTMVGADMDRFLGKGRRSVHEVGLLDLLDIARLTEHLPANRALVGIQPDLLDWGEAPTPVVQAAIPRAAEAVLGLLQDWHGPLDIQPAAKVDYCLAGSSR